MRCARCIASSDRWVCYFMSYMLPACSLQHTFPSAFFFEFRCMCFLRVHCARCIVSFDRRVCYLKVYVTHVFIASYTFHRHIGEFICTCFPCVLRVNIAYTLPLKWWCLRVVRVCYFKFYMVPVCSLQHTLPSRNVFFSIDVTCFIQIQIPVRHVSRVCLVTILHTPFHL